MMASYYVYCEVHGRLPGDYRTPEAASKARSKHRREVPGPHGRIRIIEQSTLNKYGQDVIQLKQYRPG